MDIGSGIGGSVRYLAQTENSMLKAVLQALN